MNVLRRIAVRRFATAIGKPFEYTPERAADYLSKYEGGQVIVEKYGADFPDVAVLTIDNSKKRNGLTGKMMSDLHQAITKLEQQQKETRLILVRGAAQTFCSGGDLGFVRQIANSDDGFIMCSLMSNSLNRLASLPAISIAKIDGFALGGGAELASACDIRACKVDAKVGFVQGRIGVTPGWGGMPFMLRAMGYSRTLESLATAAVMDAERLKQIGFIQHIYANDQDFEAYLKKFMAIDIEPIKGLKKAASALHTRDSEAFNVERSVFASLWGGPLQLAALAANKKHN